MIIFTPQNTPRTYEQQSYTVNGREQYLEAVHVELRPIRHALDHLVIAGKEAAV